MNCFIQNQKCDRRAASACAADRRFSSTQSIGAASCTIVLLVAISGAGCGVQMQPSASNNAASPRAAAPADEPNLAQQIEAVRAGRTDRIALSHTRVSDEEFAELNGLSPLRELIIEQGELSDAAVAGLAGCQQLERLVLRGAAIDDAGMQVIGGLRKLKFLNLPQARFTDAGLAAISGLSELVQLRFGSPNVTDEGLQHIAAIPKLRYLHLIDVPISDRGLAELTEMQQLESLYLDGGRASDAGIERLLNALPNLHFHIDQQHHDRDPHKHPHD